MRGLVLKDKIKGLFVSSGGTNAPSGSAGQTPGGRLKPVPVALAAFVVLGGACLAVRLVRKRKRTPG